MRHVRNKTCVITPPHLCVKREETEEENELNIAELVFLEEHPLEPGKSDNHKTLRCLNNYIFIATSKFTTILSYSALTDAFLNTHILK